MTDKEVEEFVRYMYYAKAMDSLCPEIVATDKIAIKVLKSIAQQRSNNNKEEKE